MIIDIFCHHISKPIIERVHNARVARAKKNPERERAEIL